ncbi:hypothetical protein, partial [Mycetocola sp.]|uniref:hypothetical protein n=1 Tax=Mycetocola sp. TaxID=1871042 RepID=UPI002638CE16
MTSKLPSGLLDVHGDVLRPPRVDTVFGGDPGRDDVVFRIGRVCVRQDPSSALPALAGRGEDGRV